MINQVRKWGGQLVKFLPSRVRRNVNLFRLGRALVLNRRSYLVNTGYVHTRLTQRLENRNGKSIPWFNYAFIAFLEERLEKDMRVLEFGSGASTFYFAEKCIAVTSIEYDRNWYEKLMGELKEKQVRNVEIIFRKLDGGYEQVGQFLNAQQKIDVAVIDGRRRVETAINCFPYLSNRGVVILDDSLRERYQPIFDFYRGKGFAAISFEGIKAGGFKRDRATVFYRRTNNCFEL